MRTVLPVLDPLAQQAAINLLEAQRAAYRRYARAVETQRQSLGDGDGDRAVAAAASAASGLDMLHESARALHPVLDRASRLADPNQLRELQSRMGDMMRDAQFAASAIDNLTAQLQAWRDAYGRQLAEVGLAPGSAAGHGPGLGTTVPGSPELSGALVERLGVDRSGATVGAGPHVGVESAVGSGPDAWRGYQLPDRAGTRHSVPSLIDRRG